MLDKFKRLIPEIQKKFSNRFKAKSNTDSETSYIRSVYEFLDNSETYENSHIYEKIWYLRGRFNWFHYLSKTSPFTADASLLVLEEIMEELENLAYVQLEMRDTIAILNFKNEVGNYYCNYVAETSFDERDFDIDFPEGDHEFDEIWFNRYLFDDGMQTNNINIINSVLNWIKSLGTGQKGEKAKAIKNIIKEIKKESKNISFEF